MRRNTKGYIKTDASEEDLSTRPRIGLDLGHFAERIRTVIGERSVLSFARDAGVDEKSLRKYMLGETEPSLGAVIKIAHAAHVRVEWLTTGEGPMRRGGEEAEHAGYVAVPLYNGVHVAAGTGGLVEHEVPDDALIFKEDWLRFELSARPQDLYLIRVAGDSMEPTLRSGDVALVDRRATQPNREGIYIMRINDMLLVKRLQALPGGVLRVTSDNAAFAPFEVQLSDINDDSLAVIGRVVWAGRRL